MPIGGLVTSHQRPELSHSQLYRARSSTAHPTSGSSYEPPTEDSAGWILKTGHPLIGKFSAGGIELEYSLLEIGDDDDVFGDVVPYQSVWFAIVLCDEGPVCIGVDGADTAVWNVCDEKKIKCRNVYGSF
ncbi:unnamed protein product [Aspergillus oryzae]|uniref:Unnamed protein product n=2 Tax=Aspergillus oryzae TaxID=5062 RepID=A0AAN4YJZ0_ASPOZ|nr:unnamed protein product [Aspergillus oryzae]GMF87836.1 unnamed protein product [Aspergillus oryzae]GMG09593.1 unnamed protein product [Aspergillus oryzae]GMG29175.1 unnamed protein product [Aspergillus oryzae]GMG51890.1 unnamed protein product [Aspergillus oryzae var. brunneus]